MFVAGFHPTLLVCISQRLRAITIDLRMQNKPRDLPHNSLLASNSWRNSIKVDSYGKHLFNYFLGYFLALFKLFYFNSSHF